MFCPKCGKADQAPESYCRQCGIFLPDLSKPVKPPHSPEQHITANIVLSSMSIVAGLTLAILLWAVLAFRPDTHPLIYVTAGVLFAMAMWHIQTLWRTLQLRKYLKREKPKNNDVLLEPPKGGERQLTQADSTDVVPASVTERTTRQLAEKGR